MKQSKPEQLTVRTLGIEAELQQSRESVKATREMITRNRANLKEVKKKIERANQVIERCQQLLEPLGIVACPSKKIAHESVSAAQGHCQRLRGHYPQHTYVWYVCRHSHSGKPHYHVATSNASVGSLIRNGMFDQYDEPLFDAAEDEPLFAR